MTIIKCSYHITPSKHSAVVSQSVPKEGIYPSPLQQIDDILRKLSH